MFHAIQEKIVANVRLSGDEVAWLINQVGTGRIADAQMGSLIMSICKRYNESIFRQAAERLNEFYGRGSF